VVGAKTFFVLIAIANFIRTPLFWQSTSLYSFDIAPPPIWVSGVYVFAAALFLYYPADRTQGSKPEIATPSSLYILLPADILRIATMILTATILALVIVSAANFVLPHNISGDIFELFILLLFLLLAFTYASRKAH
jgi:hypothetical protein